MFNYFYLTGGFHASDILVSKGGITLQRLGRRLPTYGPALGSANESSQTLIKVGLRHRTPVNVVFTGNFQHVENCRRLKMNACERPEPFVKVPER